jgi:hypothetical protein
MMSRRLKIASLGCLTPNDQFSEHDLLPAAQPILDALYDDIKVI